MTTLADDDPETCRRPADSSSADLGLYPPAKGASAGSDMIRPHLEQSPLKDSILAHQDGHPQTKDIRNKNFYMLASKDHHPKQPKA